MQSFFTPQDLPIPAVRPRRAAMVFVQRWYGLLVAGFVTLIVAVTIMPYAFWPGVAALLGYWAYYLAKHLYRSRQGPRKRPLIAEPHLARALVLLLGVTALQVYLYKFTDFLANGGGDHTLWLLLLLSTLLVSQRGSTEQVIIVQGCAIASLTGVALVAAPAGGPLALVLLVAERSLWLVLVSLTLHLLVRFLGDLNADVRLMQKATEDLLQSEQEAIRGGGENGMRQIEQAVVELIQANYKFPHANLFERKPDGRLECVAAASPAGKGLIGFSLFEERSLVVKAALSMNPILSNDTQIHPDYLPHPLFPKTRSELVVPIVRHGQVLGVLDVQAERKNAFLDQDLDVLGVLAAALGRTLDNITAHGWRRSYSTTIQSIAARLLAQGDLGGTLEAIAQAALELLGADIVVLYARDPIKHELYAPKYAGDLLFPEMLRKPRLTPGGLFSTLLKDPRETHYDPDLSKGEQNDLFLISAATREPGRPPFEEREKVQARAVLKLVAGHECVGIMFVDYRQPHVFSEAVISATQTFAHLAALATRQAQLDEMELELQKRDMGELIHDQFKSITSHAIEAITHVLKNDSLSDEGDRQRLSAAHEMLAEMSQAIVYLHQALKEPPGLPLSASVAEIADRVRKIYDIPVDVDWAPEADDLSLHLTTQIKLMLGELVHNAMHHGQATWLRLGCRRDDGSIQIVVADRGRGFAPALVRPSGLEHARLRTVSLGGTWDLQAAPGLGACITVVLPVAAWKKESA